MALTKVTGQVIKNTTDVTVGVLTVTNTLAVGGTVSIGGTLTYEDVTNVDAVGVITARSTIDAQGDVSIADSIVHTGDTNTKIRFPAADTITAETGGSERLRIDSDGDLIHTAVNKTLSLVSNQNASNAGTKIAFFGANRYDTDEEFAAIKGLLVSNSGGSGSKQNGGLQFVVGSASHTHAMTQAGYVGIGTGNPSYKLHVYGGNARITQPAGTDATFDIQEGTTTNPLRLSQTATEARIQNISSLPLNIRSQSGSGSTGYLAFWTRDDERLRIISDGKVGINTTSPISTLDVKGAITGNGSIYIEAAGVTNGGQTLDKTITFNARGVFLALISFSLGKTTTEFSRNIYSLGLFTPRSNGATWTAIQQDLTSSHVGNFTISDAGTIGALRVQKSAGSDSRTCAFRIDVLSSANVEITVTDT